MPDTPPTQISTLLKLYAPKEVGITLVPLEDIEQSETVAFWASIFLMVCSLTIGTLLPLLLTDYTNQPVIAILTVISVFFVVISVCFIRRASAIRKKARAAAVGPQHDPKENDTVTNETKALKGTILFLYALNKHVFRGAPTLTKENFLRRVPDMFADSVDANEAMDVFEDFQKLGFIETFETESKVLYVRPSLTVLESMGYQDAKISKGE